MPSSSKYAAAVLAALISLSSAQSHTNCDPMDKTCPADEGSTTSTFSYDFTQSSDLSQWNTTSGTVTSSENGAEFTINEKGDSPTIQTEFYIFFGEVTVTMQAAPGTGIVSSAILESDDLDEVDWEMLGGYTTKIQTDYYGKGDSGDYGRWTWVNVSNPQTNFYTYKWVWTEEQLTWSIDGTVVRTLKYEDAVNGTRYPQTPMTVRLGIWAGGDSDNAEGTIEWAGGETDYSDGPYTMYVKSVDIVSYYPAESYNYTDKSGSMDSIDIIGSVSGTTSVSSPSTSSTSSASSQSSDSFITWASSATPTVIAPAASLGFTGSLGTLSVMIMAFMIILSFV
ncbi:concanavalin A-like lectin/glucanase [Penicillium macrosclerotiorum]|uniref:concanavalin A-like lectin/glucanase n=1 Tax=Penicillium macrosclerotiorum TaxID=303699 RepID=UPI002547B051|nr:concanavalin A-like lectin/glucanase [Penicillium macrosclerotiorum]KAJ5679700.1 concanavalin A-like lectin/glucanase [Penicillium macrosclerotiorum]